MTVRASIKIFNRTTVSFLIHLVNWNTNNSTATGTLRNLKSVRQRIRIWHASCSCPIFSTDSSTFQISFEYCCCCFFFAAPSDEGSLQIIIAGYLSVQHVRRRRVGSMSYVWHLLIIFCPCSNFLCVFEIFEFICISLKSVFIISISIYTMGLVFAAVACMVRIRMMCAHSALRMKYIR